MNFGTAYLDGSGVYGATPESAEKLREFDGGFLKVSRNSEEEMSLLYLSLAVKYSFVLDNHPHPENFKQLLECFCYEILFNCTNDKYRTFCCIWEFCFVNSG